MEIRYPSIQWRVEILKNKWCIHVHHSELTFKLDKDKIEFRVIVTNEITVFTNEILYVNSWFKILQIDLSTQLTSNRFGESNTCYLSQVQAAFPQKKQISQYFPYNNLNSDLDQTVVHVCRKTKFIVVIWADSYLWKLG